MISINSSPVQDLSIPYDVADKVLTIGLEHKPYKGGIGYLIYVYEKYFPVFKYVTTYRMLPSKAALSVYFAKQYLRFFWTLVRDRELRIVHIHGASYGSFYRKFIIFLTAKYLFGHRTIYHMNGSEFKVFFEEGSPFRKRLVRFMVEQTDVMICLSKSWETFFKSNFRMKQIEVLANVVDLPQRPAGASRSLGNGPLKVLFLGLLGKRKGVFDLLDVIRAHRTEFTDRLQLTIGGNGEVDKLEQYIAEHQLEDIVHFAGWVTGEHKQRLLSESDVYILPSYNEGLPLAILEAMSYELPIISTPVGGTAEAVHDGVNGFLVEPGDKEAIYNRLKTLLENPALTRQMGQASGQIIERYLPQAILPKLLVIYQNLLVKVA